MAWSVEDREYALAYEMWSQLQCGNCGKPLEESTDPANQFGYDGELVRCHACAAQNRTVQKFVEDGGDQAGIMFRFR